MKKPSLILFILLGYFVTFSQNNTGKYYHLVNKAEEEICNDNYAKAFSYYNAAFKKVKVPFFTDLRNAFICGYYTHKPEKKLTDYAIQIHSKTGEFDDLIDSVDRDERYYRIEKAAIAGNTTVDHTLAASIDSLMAEDQKVRKKCPVYQSSCINEIRIVDSSNYFALLNLFDRYGEITEENAGRKAIFSIGIMICHSSMWCRSQLMPSLYEQVKKGTYDAREYDQSCRYFMYDDKGCNYSEELDYGASSFMIIDSILFVTCEDATTINKINQRRSEIFLDDMNAMIKKSVYWYSHREFRIGTFPMIYRDTPEAEKSIAQEQKDYIDKTYTTSSRYFDLRKN